MKRVQVLTVKLTSSNPHILVRDSHHCLQTQYVPDIALSLVLLNDCIPVWKGSLTAQSKIFVSHDTAQNILQSFGTSWNVCMT